MIINIVKKDLTPPHIEDIAIQTLAVMEEYKIYELPVVDGANKFLGTIEDNSILNMENIQQSLQFVQNTFKNISIFLESHVFEAMQIISEHKIPMLPVINKTSHYIGYVTPLDIITKIGQIRTPNSTTNIIVISLNRKNYSLYEVSRLIEENNAKILTSWHEIINEKMNLHLLITSNHTKGVIQALERYDYVITDTFFTNSEIENLDNRFESFIKYLNP